MIRKRNYLYKKKDMFKKIKDFFKTLEIEKWYHFTQERALWMFIIIALFLCGVIIGFFQEFAIGETTIYQCLFQSALLGCFAPMFILIFCKMLFFDLMDDGYLDPFLLLWGIVGLIIGWVAIGLGAGVYYLSTAGLEIMDVISPFLIFGILGILAGLFVSWATRTSRTPKKWVIIVGKVISVIGAIAAMVGIVLMII